MRGRRHKLQVSTFPFLAVLLCAMGSLILVLLVMDRKAHQAARARARREAVRLEEERAHGAAMQQAERARLQQKARKTWEQKRNALHDKLTREQVEMQLQMRKVRDQLREIAARLHYEQDTSTQLRRKVLSERDRLRAEEQLLRTLRSRSEQTANQSKESSQTLRRMTLDLLQMEQALKDLKAARKREQKTFSVVPYHGRRGENRRPLYVECTSDGVVFHPERKAMAITALLIGAEDPSSAVRAEVEQRIARQRAKLAGMPANVDKTPYLLLLLRPGGVNTYHLFQRALKDLPVDFGYEFIDDDWVLDFPADDEQPSTQPWMIATKSTSPASPTAVTASAPKANDHPIPLAPMGDFGISSGSGGTHGFRAGETGGTGNWVRGSRMGDGSGGSRAAMTGGLAGRSGLSSSVPGLPGRGGGGGGQGTGPGGAQGSNGLASASGSSTGGTGAAASSTLPVPISRSGGGGNPLLPPLSSGGSDGRGEGGGIGAGVLRGNGHGHRSALAPSFRDGGGGMGVTGDGAPPGDGFRGTGNLVLNGSATGHGSASSLGGASGIGDSGFPITGNSGRTGIGGSDVAGLGPPRALSSAPGNGSAGGGTGSSGSAGTGFGGNRIPGSSGSGNGMPERGGAASNIPGSAPATGTVADGRYSMVQGNKGDGSGQALNLGGGDTNAGNTVMPGALGGGGSSPGVSGSRTSPGNPVGETQLRPFQPGPDTAAKQSFAPVPSQAELGNEGKGPGGSSSGAQPYIGGNPGGGNPGNGNPGGGNPEGATPAGGNPGGGNAGGSASGSTSVQANNGRTSERVIFGDPLTGKPTTPPRPTSSPSADSTEERPPEKDDKQSPPRVRVIMGNGGGGGAGGDPQAEAMNRFAPTPSAGPVRHKPATMHPAWVHGGRDWTIYVECRGDSLVLYPSQRAFALTQILNDPAGNPLTKAIQQMIDRRQALRRQGEPPYRPQLCLLVRPEHIRTLLTVYPALEALPVPKTRRNLDADDDVIDIINGSTP